MPRLAPVTTAVLVSGIGKQLLNREERRVVAATWGGKVTRCLWVAAVSVEVAWFGRRLCDPAVSEASRHPAVEDSRTI
jgi:hypothetical protein